MATRRDPNRLTSTTLTCSALTEKLHPGLTGGEEPHHEQYSRPGSNSSHLGHASASASNSDIPPTIASERTLPVGSRVTLPVGALAAPGPLREHSLTTSSPVGSWTQSSGRSTRR